ncbi:MAG: hypothetical protein FJY40_11395 [Betaproteobacteria bacterium]|nr:hypothetical protein [Betaproteobacteria bacterium]
MPTATCCTFRSSSGRGWASCRGSANSCSTPSSARASSRWCSPPTCRWKWTSRSTSACRPSAATAASARASAPATPSPLATR